MFKLFKSDEMGPSEYKYALFNYRHLRMKMCEVLEAVFGGYPEDKYIFYDSSDVLDDYFTEIKREFLKIDKIPEIMKLPLTDIRAFDIYSNYKDNSSLWENLRNDIYKENQQLTKDTQFDYDFPAELQVTFNKIDQLVKEHTEQKNKILKSNHIYPATKYYYGILVNKDGFRKRFVDYLAQNDQDEITITKLVDKFKKTSNYIWIVINQLNKTFEKKQSNLRIESKDGHIRLIIS